MARLGWLRARRVVLGCRNRRGLGTEWLAHPVDTSSVPNLHPAGVSKDAVRSDLDRLVEPRLPHNRPVSPVSDVRGVQRAYTLAVEANLGWSLTTTSSRGTRAPGA